MEAQPRAGKEGLCLIELVAEGGYRACPMGRTLRCQSDLQLRLCDLEICRAGQRGLKKRPPFLVRPLVMRRDQSEEIALGLIGHHFNQVGQVFTFRGQLHDRLVGDGLDRNPPG